MTVLLARNTNFSMDLFLGEGSAPLESHADENALLEAGLADEVTGLDGTLFAEVAMSGVTISVLSRH